MDENEFMKAFMNVDLLQLEGAAQIIGRVVAKLHAGMVEGGMNPFIANKVIEAALKALFDSIAESVERANERNDS